MKSIIILVLIWDSSFAFQRIFEAKSLEDLRIEEQRAKERQKLVEHCRFSELNLNLPWACWLLKKNRSGKNQCLDQVPKVKRLWELPPEKYWTHLDSRCRQLVEKQDQLLQYKGEKR